MTTCDCSKCILDNNNIKNISRSELLNKIMINDYIKLQSLIINNNIIGTWYNYIN